MKYTKSFKEFHLILAKIANAKVYILKDQPWASNWWQATFLLLIEDYKDF